MLMGRKADRNGMMGKGVLEFILLHQIWAH